MSLPKFLTALFECGRVQVPPPQEAMPPREATDARPILLDRARSAALGFPGEPPSLDLDVALWAAQQFFRASQLAVYRELDATAIDRLLGQPCPPATAPVRHWSVDLVFVFLPDLLRLARSASEQDPLVLCLRGWAAEWPLSSVGVANVEPRNVEELLTHAGLCQLYVDRILTHKDWSRLRDENVRTAVRQSLGAYDSLWPDAVRGRLEA